VQAVLQDLIYAVRSFARKPLFAGVIVLTLALGIGSTVAIFSVANAVLFRPLPFQNPQELAFIWNRLPKTSEARSLISGPDLKDYQEETSAFQGFGAAMAFAGTITGEGPPARINNAYVSANTLDLLGVRPILGRTHVAEDAFPINPQDFGSPNPNLPPHKVVLSWGLWQNRFGGDSTVIGRNILLDGWGSEIIGVLPRDFRVYLPADAAMPSNIDAWGILPSNLADFQRDAAFLTVVTRLKPGVTLAQGQEDMDRLAARLR
jgi:putative ABC transport system permease protein